MIPAFKNAVTFVPHSGTKVLASLAASLAAQDVAGHLIPFCEIPLAALPLRGLHAYTALRQHSCQELVVEAGCAPSSTPAYSLTFFSRIERFFDRLSEAELSGQFCFTFGYVTRLPYRKRRVSRQAQ